MHCANRRSGRKFRPFGTWYEEAHLFSQPAWISNAGLGFRLQRVDSFHCAAVPANERLTTIAAKERRERKELRRG